MKINRIIVIAYILLAIFSIGMVCASDINETSNDLMGVDDASVEFGVPYNADIETSDGGDILATGEGTFAEVQSMIDGAGAGDTIVLSKDYLGSGSEITVNKQITIDGNNRTLNANGASRIFNIAASNVVLKNLNMVCGKSASSGGAVCWIGDDGVMDNCRIKNSNAYDGGALYYKGSNGVVRNSVFANNSAYYNGAVYMNSLNAQIVNCSFTKNTATNSSGALGWVKKGNGLISLSEFSNNRAPYGAAVYINNATGICVDTCVFNDNNATYKGGAIYWEGGNYGTIADSTFKNNDAGLNGGAVYLYECDLINITRSSFEGSSVSENGGAVYCYAPKCEGITISESSFSKCSSDGYGMGGAFRFYGGKSSVVGCSFADCYAGYNGGAISWNSTNARLEDCSFDNCSAEFCAGAVYWDRQAINGSVFGCSFIKCAAGYFGGAISWSDKASNGFVFGCSFVGCSAEYNGGAVSWDCDDGRIENSTFINNTADSGKAIYAYNKAVKVINSTFIDKKVSQLSKVAYGVTRTSCVLNVDINTRTTVSANATTLPLGEAISITPKLIDQYATVPGVVKLYINGNLVANQQSGEGFSFTPTELGTYNVSAEFEGEGSYLASHSENMTFEVVRPIPEITISAGDITYGEKQTVSVAFSGDATGIFNATLMKNDVVVDSVSSLPIGESFEFYDLAVGVYRIVIDYSGDLKYNGTSKGANFIVRPVVNITQNVIVGDTVDVTVELANASGRITVFVDGEWAAAGLVGSNGFKTVMPTSAFAYGNHTVTFEYVGDSIDANVFNYFDDAAGAYLPYGYAMYLEPIIIENTQDHVVSDDRAVILLEVPENATGTIEVTVVDVVTGQIKTFVVEVVNGIARVDLSEFKDGSYRFTFKYSGDSKYAPFTKQSVAEIHNNVPANIISNDLSMPYGSNGVYYAIVLTKTGKPLGGLSVSFSADGKALGSAVTNGEGVASIVISLAPGTYRVTSSVSGISAVSTLKVNHILSLKKVTVKRSSKKLVLSATLAKVNGKYLKGKKVTFKFNGKKFTAKTNNKGVAKVTVKSSVLKKLKVGKKVTYQATYLKDTVKQTVKIKK